MKRKSKLPILSLDFETTTDEADCRVWHWGYVDIYTEQFVWGTNIAEWAAHMSKRSVIGYYHNLKFDGMFIIDYLLRCGYQHTTERFPAPGQFTTLISDMGKMYSMAIGWKNGKRLELRDSAKKFPNFSVAKIAKSFKLEEAKGSIDYHKPRPVGYQPTEDEIEYLRLDVLIVAKAIRMALDEGMSKLTIGSDSLAEYKKLTGTKKFQWLYPQFGHVMDAEIRRAYRGGFTYADPRFQGGVVGEGVVVDVNSLYPYIMAERLLPYGEPIFVDGLPKTTPERPLSVFAVTFTAKLKDRHIPCIQIKGASQFIETEYQTVIEEPTQLMVTNVDWDLYNRHYDIDVYSYGGGWLFKATTGTFDDYIAKWSAVKESSTGGRRELAKLHLNSLYGKFASNPNVTSKYPVYDEKTDRVKLIRGVEETRAPVYTPVGVFVTAWARMHTITAAQENYDMFAYADTDSLHLVTEGAAMSGGMVEAVPLGLDLHPTRLGAWGYEYSFEAAMFLRAKAYSERHYDGTYTTRIAGLPVAISETLTFDDLRDGNVVTGKLTPKIVPGGVVLVDTPYKLVVK